MIMQIYKKALAVLMKKPLRLWGISLMNLLLCTLAYLLFGAVIGVGICIALLLNTSMTMIFLHGYRGEDVQVTQLFDCFKDAGTAKHVLGGMLWMDLWIFIWSLIPVAGVVFGAIRAYEYRLTPYILMTEPEIPATEAIKVSKARTEGWKGKMFGADILYAVIVWAASLILSLLANIPFIGVLFGIADFVLILGVAAFSSLFIGLVHSAFYEEITKPKQKAENYCPRCGAAVKKDNAFCPACGAPLKAQQTVGETAPDNGPASAPEDTPEGKTEESTANEETGHTFY